MQQKYYASAFLALIVCSCSFIPNDDNFITITPPDLNQYSIALDSLDQFDTIRLYGSTTFRFKLSLEARGRLEGMKAFIGNRIVYESPHNYDGEFRISRSQLSTGLSSLRIEFIASSGTGSLVNTLESETITVTKEWPLVIDVDPPATDAISFTIEHGFLKLTWPEFDNPTFRKYILKLIGSNDQVKETLEINDPKTNYWINQEYIGEGAYYQLDIETDEVYWNGQKKFYSNPISVVATVNQSDSLTHVSWGKTPYFGSFKEYVVRNETTNETFIVSGIEDTVFSYKLMNVPFGSELKFQVDVISNSGRRLENPCYCSSLWGTKIEFQPRDYASKFSTYLASSSNGYHLLNNDFSLSGSLPPVANRPIAPFKSNFLFIYNSNTIEYYNLLTRKLKSFAFPDLLNARVVQTGSISSNGLVGFTMMYDANRVNYYYYILYDIVNERIVYNGINEWSPSFFSAPNFSNDGEYFSISSKIYKLTDGTPQVIGILPLGSFFFRPDNSQHIIFFRGNKLQLFDSGTLTLSKTIEPSDQNAQFVNYDPVTGYAFWLNLSSQQGYFTHLDTNHLRTVLVGSSSTLINGHLFTSHFDKCLYIKLF